MQNVTIKKLDHSVEVDFDKLPEVSQNHIVAYGFKQILNDCHSEHVWKTREGLFPFIEDAKKLGEGEPEARKSYKSAVLAAVEVKIAALESGDISTRKPAVPDRPETNVIIDWMVRDKGLTKKVIRAAIKEHGLTMFIEAYGENKVAKEAKARAKHVDLDESTNEALDMLMNA